MTYIEETLKKDGLLLRFLPEHEQTEFLCLTAVMSRGWALQYVFNQTAAVQKAAVEQNETAKRFIKPLTHRRR